MRSFLSIVGPPCLCLGLLGGVVWENGRHAKPADAVPFHRDAKLAIDAWPRTTADDWHNLKDDELPQAAVALLKPNAVFSRRYIHAKVDRPVTDRDWDWADLLVIQCSEPEDMSGHYPPNCYPRNGSPLEWATPRVWQVPGLAKPITGMEYHFAGGNFASVDSKIVYNFFILPGRGIAPDMSAVRDATGDYQHRHFGATQVQVVFPERDFDQAGRDEIFKSLMSAGAAALQTVDPSGL